MSTQITENIATSLYYFLSTVGQVLGAMIALSGVFLVFKIQAIQKVLNNTAKEYRNSLLNNDSRTQYAIDSLVGKEAIKELLNLVQRVNKIYFDKKEKQAFIRLSGISLFFNGFYLDVMN